MSPSQIVKSIKGQTTQDLWMKYPQQLRQQFWKKKIKSHGYWKDIADIDKSTFIEPMLANKFNDHKHKLKYPVMVDRKYNGMRQVTIPGTAKTRKGEIINPEQVEEDADLAERLYWAVIS